MNVGKKLKDLRVAKKLSLQDVASKIGVSKTTLMRWENGDTQKMPSRKIEILAKVLNINPMFIVCGDEEYLSPNIPSRTRLLSLFDKMSIEQQTMLINYAKFILEEKE